MNGLRLSEPYLEQRTARFPKTKVPDGQAVRDGRQPGQLARLALRARIRADRPRDRQGRDRSSGHSTTSAVSSEASSHARAPDRGAVLVAVWLVAIVVAPVDGPEDDRSRAGRASSRTSSASSAGCSATNESPVPPRRFWCSAPLWLASPIDLIPEFLPGIGAARRRADRRPRPPTLVKRAGPDVGDRITGAADPRTVRRDPACRLAWPSRSRAPSPRRRAARIASSSEISPRSMRTSIR